MTPNSQQRQTPCSPKVEPSHLPQALPLKGFTLRTNLPALEPLEDEPYPNHRNTIKICYLYYMNAIPQFKRNGAKSPSMIFCVAKEMGKDETYK
jgi:hypothetical protein